MRGLEPRLSKYLTVKQNRLIKHQLFTSDVDADADENVCRAHTKRQVIIKMCKFNMFITAVCVLFLIKLRWPKSKSIYVTEVYCESVNLIGYITVFYLLIENSYASVHIAHHV